MELLILGNVSENENWCKVRKTALDGPEIPSGNGQVKYPTNQALKSSRLNGLGWKWAGLNNSGLCSGLIAYADLIIEIVIDVSENTLIST